MAVSRFNNILTDNRFPTTDISMKAFVRDSGELPESSLQSAAIEARLAHMEELLGELHEWMRAEQVSSLPAQYRKLYSSLITSDFDRRTASALVRALFQSVGKNEPSDEELNLAASHEIDTAIEKMKESLPGIRPRASGEKPFVVALVGPSGAGKTTMMYKLAVRAVLNFGLRVKIISCDTYKIGSVEGVQTIADILSVPFGIAFEPRDITDQMLGSDVDLVILDTAGRSDRPAREELSEFITAAAPDEIHLVLSATMSQRAIQETAALFLGERINYVTFTKLDEAPSLGGVISSLRWLGLPLGFVSSGTMIPDDLLPSREVPLGEWAIEGMALQTPDPEAAHV